jgi:hypothetical protein
MVSRVVNKGSSVHDELMLVIQEMDNLDKNLDMLNAICKKRGIGKPD